jgi:ribosome-binding factor A
MSANRMRRVDEAVRAVLSDAITQDIKDPRVGFVTVTAVKTSPDLRQARVYVSVLGDDEERAGSLAGLQSAHGYLQRRVAGELRLKHTPTLEFVYDEAVERGMRINELLDAQRRPEARSRSSRSRSDDAGLDAPRS